MTTQEVKRKLTAILAADVVGYSRLMEIDEEAALAALTDRRIVIDRLIETRGGRVFGSAGDSVVAEFPSSVEAARCAIEIQDELGKLSMLETGSPEYGVTRNYLDWATSVPWGVHSEDQLDLKHGRKVLDEHDEGLEDVKDRILEFLAVGSFKGEISGSILLLVGPPGVGVARLSPALQDRTRRAMKVMIKMRFIGDIIQF